MATATLYEKLAADIEALVQQGVLLPGEKIPSVRQAAQHHRLSITTVIRAYLLLESRGILESRPQSGYFVRARPGEPAWGWVPPSGEGAFGFCAPCQREATATAPSASRGVASSPMWRRAIIA